MKSKELHNLSYTTNRCEFLNISFKLHNYIVNNVLRLIIFSLFINLVSLINANAGVFSIFISSFDSQPYLKSTQAASLRYQESLPLIQLVLPAPKKIDLVDTSTKTPPKPQKSSQTTETVTSLAKKEQKSTVKNASVYQPKPILNSSEPKETVTEIISDDCAPKATASDFLPFFQYPGSPALETNPVPTPQTTAKPANPQTLPPSSATYKLQ